MALKEEWLPVPGFAGLYEVSDRGSVRSLERVVGQPGRQRVQRGRVLKPDRSDRYYRVTLSRESRTYRRSVHGLVAEAFIGPKPEGLQICHSDGDSRNNCAGNLRYDTASENALDRVRHGTHSNARKTHCAKGHQFTQENTYSRKRPGRPDGRRCRECELAGRRKGGAPSR